MWGELSNVACGCKRHGCHRHGNRAPTHNRDHGITHMGISGGDIAHGNGLVHTGRQESAGDNADALASAILQLGVVSHGYPLSGD